MSLRMTVKEGETPKQAMLRYAAEYGGLEDEVEWEYQESLKQGLSEQAAAWAALYEWDLLDYVDEAPEAAEVPAVSVEPQAG
jgi:hypothetical protein